MELNSWFNVMTTNVIPFDRPENRFGLHRPSVCLMVETRPTLLQEHRCALRLVRVDPVFK